MGDLLSPAIPFLPCNAYGYKVRPWNFELDKEYTNSAYLRHQEIKYDKLRKLIKEQTGVFPELVSNNHAAGKYFKENGGGMDLVRPTSQKPVPIEGVVLEAAFCFYQTDEWFTVTKWKQNLSTLIHGSQHKYPVWPWIKSVKYAYLPMPRNEKSERFQLFDYASTLLGYEKDAGVVCALPLHWVDDGGERDLNLPEYLFYDIGEPVERVAYTEIDKLLIPGRNTYMRRWSKAIVLVNPTDSDDVSIPIPQGYLDPALDAEVKGIAMPAHTGRILLKVD